MYKRFAVHHFAMTPTRPGDVAFFINDVVDLAPGVANLRIGVESKATGKVGTVAAPVRIPNLTDDGLQIATVILGLDDAREPAMPVTHWRAWCPFSRR